MNCYDFLYFCAGAVAVFLAAVLVKWNERLDAPHPAPQKETPNRLATLFCKNQNCIFHIHDKPEHSSRYGCGHSNPQFDRVGHCTCVIYKEPERQEYMP